MPPTETKAYTLHCSCGSDFKVLCPDCGKLHDGCDAEMLEALKLAKRYIYDIASQKDMAEIVEPLERVIAKVEGR